MPVFNGCDIPETHFYDIERDVWVSFKADRAGWLVRLRPTDLEAERSMLVTGAEAFERYRARITEVKVSCFRCAEESNGQG